MWNTALVFFQSLLLAGYLWAHLMTRLRRVLWQWTAQALVLCCALLTLPIGLPKGWDPAAARFPAVWLLVALALSVGLPFFTLSSTTPILQSWFSRTQHPRAHDPYFLYAAGNPGSMLALLGYPLAFEPLISLSGQRWIWSGAFLLFVALMAARALVAVRDEVLPTGPRQSRIGLLPWRSMLRWLAYAFVPASLILGVTQHLSTDVASFPWLWVLPPAVYLFTFIIAFSSRGALVVETAGWSLPIIAPLTITVIVTAVYLRNYLAWQVLLHFFGCSYGLGLPWAAGQGASRCARACRLLLSYFFGRCAGWRV